MGLCDAFSGEDRVQVKFTDFYNLMHQAVKGEFIMNGAKHGVPNECLLATFGNINLLDKDKEVKKVINEEE